MTDFERIRQLSEVRTVLLSLPAEHERMIREYFGVNCLPRTTGEIAQRMRVYEKGVSEQGIRNTLLHIIRRLNAEHPEAMRTNPILQTFQEERLTA